MGPRDIVVEFSDGDIYLGDENHFLEWMYERGQDDSEIVSSFFVGQEIKLKSKLEIEIV